MRSDTRQTVQRSLVLEAVRASNDHPTAIDVFETVRGKHPSISRATVYRNLNVLADAGCIQRISVPDAADRFDWRLDAHGHGICVRCGKVVDVELNDGISIPSLVRGDAPMDIDSFTVVFSGICDECRGQEPNPL